MLKYCSDAEWKNSQYDLIISTMLLKNFDFSASGLHVFVAVAHDDSRRLWATFIARTS
jgi:hypothetical protein